MNKPVRVYICSTYRDLVNERNAVLDAVHRLQLKYENFEYFGTRSIQPLDTCLPEIRRSDVMVLIVSHIYGVLVPGMNISFAEAEYNEGLVRGIPCLLYFREPNSGISPAHFERDSAKAAQLELFQERLRQSNKGTCFKDAVSLASFVSADLERKALEAGLPRQAVSRTGKLNIRAIETRKIPITSSSPRDSTVDDLILQTNPLLKESLKMGFDRPKLQLNRNKLMIAMAVVGVAICLALVQYFDLPILKNGDMALGVSSATLPGGDSNSVHVVSSVDSARNAMLVAEQAAIQAARRAADSAAAAEARDTVKAFIKEAKAGVASTQLKLGFMYEEGRGVPKSDTAAFKWFKMAADQGLAIAQFKVGWMYRLGRGVVKSSYRAAQWMEQSAVQGHAEAQVKLAQMYQQGRGVTKNEKMAMKWYLLAADQKEPEAQRVLAELKGN